MFFFSVATKEDMMFNVNSFILCCSLRRLQGHRRLSSLLVYQGVVAVFMDELGLVPIDVRPTSKTRDTVP